MTDRHPAARALHHPRGERPRRAALPAARDLARRQDRGRSRRHRAQDRAARRRSGAPRAAASAAGRERPVPVPQHLQALAGARPRDRGRPRQPRQAARHGRCRAVRGAGLDRRRWRAPARATPIEIAAFPVEMDAAQRPVSEFTLLALGGLLHMVGEPERKPLRLGGHQASYAAGLTAFTGLTAAFAARDAGQTPPPVRVSLAEVLQWVNWKAASGAEATGTSPGREGKDSEFQIVPCRDGHVAVVYTATQWPATRALIGDPRLGDPKFEHARRPAPAHRRALRDHHAVVRRQDPRRDPERRRRPRACRSARSSRPPSCSRPSSMWRAASSPTEHPRLGTLRMPQLPVQWNGRSFAPRPAPELAA